MYVERNCLSICIEISAKNKKEKELANLVWNSQTEPLTKKALLNVLMLSGLIPAELICRNVIKIIDDSKKRGVIRILAKFPKEELEPEEKIALLATSYVFNLTLEIEPSDFYQRIMDEIEELEFSGDLYSPFENIREPVIIHYDCA